ncbi:MAG: ligase-associated DNA damage response endonuclease PdeM [bacterium]
MTSTTTIAGEQIELHPERAAYWPRRNTLLIADPHFAKAASFRNLGVFVPKGTTEYALQTLDTLIARTRSERIIFLGDFLHAREGRNADTFNAIAEWRAAHRDVEMQIVRGNHDKRAGDPPDAVGIGCVDGPILEPPFALTHHPVVVADYYALAGHLHPRALLTGRARQWERLPCFWFRHDVGILPAFGDFTGGVDVEPAAGEAVWVVSDDGVIPVAMSTEVSP